MTKGLRIVAATIACRLLCLGAQAEAPKYSFVELGYSVYLDADLAVSDPDVNVDFDKGNGTFLTVSYGFEAFQVFAGYGSDKADFDVTMGGNTAPVETETDNWFLGGGWHGLFGEPGDLVINWGYNNLRNLTEGRGDDKNSQQGFFADIGVRWRIVKVFEIGGYARYGDLDKLGAYQDYGINALGYVGRVVVGVGYDLLRTGGSSDESAASVFVRYNFGQS